MLPEFLQQAITLGSILLLFVAIYREWVRPAVGFLGVVLGLVLLQIITPQQMLMGFSNESIASVVLLVILSSALSKNFQIESFIDRLYHLGKRDTPLSYRSFLLRMMVQVAALSSVVNNTPVVALMTPYVFNWGRKYNVSPSRLLIPLSYATIMGGMITLVGTSTTLVLNGFMTTNSVGNIPGMSLLLIGGAVCVSGILFIALLGYRLLPNHQDILNTFKENQREYLVETTLQHSSPMIGKTISEAGLRNLRGMYLVEIIRAKQIISPVEPREKLQQSDVLIFAGATEFIFDLTSNGRGLVLPQYDDTKKQEAVKVIEAVVGANSNLIGYTAKEIDFRKRYDAAIVAIHRNGERLSGKIGEIKLRQGDLLLLYAGRDFRSRVDLYRDIFIVSQVKEFLQPERKKTLSFVVTVSVAIGALLAGFLSLFTALLVIFVAMVGLRMISLADIKRDIDINMVGILVFSLALGQAMITTGSGELLAQQIINLTYSLGPTAVLVSLLVITTILTSFITNVGAISIMFPLAYAISNTLQTDGMPFYLGIAYAASAAFLTPIGYQTNLIVFGPGGYSFRDFFRIGLPVTAIYLITVLTMIKLLYPNF